MASVKATSRVRDMPTAWIRGKGFVGILLSKKTRTVLLLLNIHRLARKMKGRLSVIDIDNDATNYVVQLITFHLHQYNMRESPDPFIFKPGARLVS